MKIKILHQYHNNMYDTVKALSRIASVEFLTYRTSKLVPGIPFRQPKVIGRRFKAYLPWQLWRLLEGSNVVILKHLNDPINLVPYIVCLLKGIRVIVVVQRPTGATFPGYRALFWLLTRWLRLCKVSVMAVTDAGHRWALTYGLPSVYIPACIDPNRFRAADMHERSHASPERFHLLTVAKYQERKHIPLLIQAVSVLTRQYPTILFSLTIVGSLSTRPESSSAYKKVQAEIRRCNLEQRVTLKINIPFDKMPAEYAAADVFIQAAESEPLGYAVVEAMAIGLPVLSSHDVGAASYIDQGKNGYVFAARSSEAIVAALRHFITDSGTINTELVSRFGHTSQEIIAQKHQPDAFLRGFRNLLNSF